MKNLFRSRARRRAPIAAQMHLAPSRLRPAIVEALEQRIAPASVLLNAAAASVASNESANGPLPPPTTFITLPNSTPETPGVSFPVTNGAGSGTVLAVLDSSFVDSATPTPFASGILRSFVVDRDPTAGVALDFYYQLVNTSPGPDSFGEADFYRMKTVAGFDATANPVSVGQTTSLTGLSAGTSGINFASYTQGAGLQAAATADRDVGTPGSVGFDFPTQPPLPFTGDPNDVNFGESSTFIVVRTNATNYASVQMSISGSASSTAFTFAPVAPASAFIVTTTLDTIAADGVTSLREAITAANATPGTNTITFNIAGAGVKTIAPTAALPEITEAVIIDGYSQPGTSVNTLSVGTNANLLIQLDGAQQANGHGLILGGAGGSTVRGLVISGFHPAINDNGHGIAIHSSNNIVAGNFIGTDPTGTLNKGNANAGVSVGTFLGGASFTGNRIGGSALADHNILSGGAYGVQLTSDSVGTQVLGNLVGTDKTGTVAIPNTNTGIANRGSGTIIGGTTAGAGNVISGNTGWGINTGGTNTTIQGNFIGTNAAGTAALANGRSGVNFSNGANTALVGGTAAGAANVISGNVLEGIEIGSDFFDGAGNNITVLGNWIGTSSGGGIAIPNQGPGIGIFDTTGAIIGGTNAGEANTIANNGAEGILLKPLSSPLTGVRIAGNGIFNNTRLGIDHFVSNDPASGVTPNDAGDTDGRQNYPVITSVAPNSVSGALSSSASAAFTIHFYASTAADPSGFGEGRTYLGSTTANTSLGGVGTFTFTPSAAIPAGSFVTATATATAATGSTSEFSAAAQLTGPLTFIWDAGGGGDTSWFNPLNWNFDSGVPGAADTAILNTNATINLPSSTSVGTFQISAGTFTSPTAVTLTIANSLAWTGGTMSGAGTAATTLLAGSASTLGGAAVKTLAGRTINVDGTLAWSGAGNFALNSGNLIVSTTGVFDLQSDALLGDADGSATVAGLFVRGILKKSAGTETSALGGNLGVGNGFVQTTVNASGTVRAENGTLQFDAALNNLGIVDALTHTVVLAAGTGAGNGTFHADAGGVVRVTGGVQTLNAGAAITGAGRFDIAGGRVDLANLANVSATNVALSNTASVLSLGGVLTVTQSFDWQGGAIGGGSSLILAAGSSSTIGGATTKVWNTGNLQVNGTLAWSGTGSLDFAGGGALTVGAGGLFDLQSDATFGNSAAGSNASLIIDGTLRKTAGAGTSRIVGTPGTVTTIVNATGRVEVQSGTLQFGNALANNGRLDAKTQTILLTNTTGTDTSSGVFNADAGGVVRLSVGTQTLTSGAAITGAGRFEVITNGRLDVAANVSATNLSLNGLGLIGTGALTITQNLDWVGASMTGTGTTTIAAGAALTLNNGSNLGLARTLNIAGAASWVGGSTVTLANPAVINIQSGATFDVNSGAQMANPGGGAVSINNAGTFRKTGVGSTTTFAANVPFTNTGTVISEVAAIAFDGGFTQTAGSTQLNGGGLAAVALNFSGGELRGAGTVVGNVNNTGATVRPGGTGAAGTILVEGYTQGAGGTLAIELGGTGAGQFDVLDVTGPVTLGGAINFAHINAFTPASGNTFRVVQSVANPGTFATLTGASAGKTQTASATGLVIAQAPLNVFTWDAGAGADTSWFTAANWSPDGIPGTADTAILNTNVTINLPGNTSVGTFQQTDGTFTSPAGVTFTVLNSFAWTGGTQGGAGTTISSGTLTLSGAATKNLNARTLINNGTANLSGGNAVAINANFTNNGIFNATDNGSLLPSGTATFTNTATGTLNKSGAGTTSSVPAFTNTGTVNVAGGTLNFGNGFTQTAGSTVLNGGSVSGFFALDFQGGELRGTGTVTGSVSNSGAIVRPGGTGAAGTLTIGSYTQAAGGRLALEIGGTGAGQFDVLAVTGNASLAGPAAVAFINGFTPGSADTFRVITAATRGGTFQFVNGTLLAQYNATNVTLVVPPTGIFNWDAGAGADTSWFNPVNWSPDGVPGATDTAILTINATITLPTSTSVGTYTHNIGTANGDNSIMTISAGATLTVLNNFTWRGGTESGAGTLTVAPGATFIYPGSGGTSGLNPVLSDRTLNLQGASTFSHPTSERLDVTGATINNSGNLEFRNQFQLAGLTGALNNLAGGTIRTTTASSSLTTALPFTNAGTVRTEAGSLSFSGAFTQTAGSTQIAGGLLLTFGAGFQLQGGELTGVGNFTGAVNNTGGTVRPGGTGTIGSLSIGGNYTQAAGGTVELEIAGAGAGQFDVLLASGNAVLAGTLNAPLLGGFTPAAGNTFRVLDPNGSRTGTFATVNAPGLTAQYNASDVTLIVPASTTYTWDAGAGADTSWFTAANWSPDGVPGAADTAILNTNATITLSAANATVTNFSQTLGTLTGTSALTVTGSFTWSGGTESGTGATTLPGGATGAWSGALALNGRTINNSGTIGLTGTGNVTTSNGPSFHNLAGGIVDLQSDAGFVFGGLGGNLLFDNVGTLRKTGGTGASSFVPITNTGTILAQTGTLSFAQFTQTAGSTVLAGGNLGGGISFAFQSGELRGAGTITGTVANAAATVRPGGTGAAGTLAITGNYSQTTGATLLIEVGGTGAGQFDRVTVGGSAFFNGNSVLNSSLIGGFAPAAGTQVQAVTANAVSGGAVVGGNFSAQFNANNVTLTAVASPIFNWDAGAGADTSWFNPLNWSPDGVPGATDTAILNIDKTITLPSSTSVGTFQQSNPSFVGANAIFTSPAGATLTVLNSFSWAGGTQSGAGATTVAPGATLTIATSGQDVTLNQHTLNLNGTTVFPSSFTSGVALANGATINNSGVLDFQGPVVFSGTGTFNNLAGATIKNTTTNHTVIVNNPIAFTNAGIVQSQIGTLGFNGGYTQSAGSTRMVGGAISVSGTLLLNGGEFTGAGAFVGSIDNIGGVIRPGGAGAIGTITTNGNFTQRAGGTIETELAGTAAGQFDVFAPGGVASLAGTLTAPLLGGFTPATGDTFRVLTYNGASGTFATTPAFFTTQYNAQNVTLMAGAVVASPFVVTTASDVVNANDGVVSLREAITSANATAGADTITFNIPGGGVKTLTVSSALPALTEAVVINGYTQPGSSANTFAVGNNAVLNIVLRGASSTLGDGLTISASGVTVRGLVVQNFASGITVNGANAVIAGNWIGVSQTGAAAAGNANGGIQVSADGATIGGSAPADRNVISGNAARGVLIFGSNTLVKGNYIGTNAAGTAAVKNGFDGLTIAAPGSNNLIGGNTAADRNVISGNDIAGVTIESFSAAAGFATGNRVQGNYIGVAADGVTRLGNQAGSQLGWGVGIFRQVTGSVIGGTGAGEGNVIAANAGPGIGLEQGASANRFEGNFIGTNSAGATGLGNGASGIIVINSPNNIIGDANVPNVIGFNARHGIELTGTGTTGTLVQNNFAGVTPGTFPGGSQAIPNALAGIALLNGASGNDIGGTSRGNIIAGNTGDGVLIDRADGNTVRGNRIGQVGVTNGFFPNGGAGVNVNDSLATRIGSISGSELNIISHNTGAGIRVTDTSTVTARGNIMEANGGLAIDLAGDGVTANDALDADSGPNSLLNFPVLTSATVVSGSTYNVVGTYDGAANATFTIDLYANAVADPSGFGEALSRLTSFTVTTDAAGRASFSQNVTASAGAAIFTANATDSAGASSEFSAARAGTVFTTNVGLLDSAAAEGQADTSTVVFRVRLSENAKAPVSVHFATHDLTTSGAATAGIDYDALTGDVNFAIGENEKTIAVTIHGDLTPEQREHFGLTLSNANGANIVGGEARGAILDDDHHLFFAAQGSGSRVEIRNAEDGGLVRGFFAFAPGFQGGVRVASGDVNGDGFNDVIVGTGDGGGARVRVFDGHNVQASGKPVKLHDFYAYGNSYRGGVYVAAGDVDGDGKADIIVSPSAGSNNKVKVFSGADGSLQTSFLAFGRGAGGVRVAAGDINGDGHADIIAGTGAGASVRVFDVHNGGELLSSFRAFPRSYTGGITVVSGDVNGDGLDDVIVGAGRGSSIARIFLGGQPGNPIEFAAFGNSTHGINVGVVDVNSDGIADIIAAQARNAAPRIRIYKGNSILNGTPRSPIDVTAFESEPDFVGGVYVG